MRAKKEERVPVKVHIMPRLSLIGEFDWFEKNIRHELTDFDSSKLRTEGYVTGLMRPSDFLNLSNSPSIFKVNVLLGRKVGMSWSIARSILGFFTRR